VLLVRDDGLIGRPKIAVAEALAIRRGNSFPQTSTCGFASISDGVGYHLTGGTAERDPNPALIGLFEDE
jgi:hypothetical protein